MRKGRPWHKLWLIIPGLIIFLPLGLFMLWTSSRTLRAKIAISAVSVLLMAGVFTGVFAAVGRTEIPACGYDVTRNSRGCYRTPTILPFEREVFNSVVNEMGKLRTTEAIVPDQIISIEQIQPDAGASQIVAERLGLDYEDVKAIHLKVSSKLVGAGK